MMRHVDHGEAKRRTIALLRSSIAAHEEHRFSEIGQGYDAVYEYLTGQELPKSPGLRQQFRLVKDYLCNVMSTSPFQRLFQAVNFVNNWMDSAAHDWGYGDESSWVPEARRIVTALEKDENIYPETSNKSMETDR